MNPEGGLTLRSFLAGVGSLWLAVLLLVLLATAMACATVYESTRGTEYALARFYKSWWFIGLEGLLALNSLAAILARLPLSVRQFGFLLTHLSILVVLAGAFITWKWSIDGQVALQNGETTETMLLNRDTLLFENTADGQGLEVDLSAAGIGGLDPVDSPRIEPLVMGDAAVEVRRYSPHMEASGQPPRESRMPAVLLAIRSPERSEPEQVWLQKHTAQRFRAGGAIYRLSYTDQDAPLGFPVSLESFEIGRYPGTGRPRTFESRVIFGEQTTGAKKALISMNRPAQYGGYTFYQSSYREDRRGGMTTILSVAWDPGQPIVFAGYISMMTGMLWVLVIRVADRRRQARAEADGTGISPTPGKKGRQPGT